MSKSEKSLSPKKKQTLIAVIGFVSGLLSGLLGAPYAGLISGVSEIAIQAVESAPEKDTDAPKPEPAPVVPAVPETPVEPAAVPVVPEAVAPPAAAAVEATPSGAPVSAK